MRAFPGRATRFHRHIEATEAHFYETPGGGIRDVTEWYQGHKGDDAWEKASGVYIRVLSEPQLFIEGNHRTGALDHELSTGPLEVPAFVLKVDNAKDTSTLHADPDDPQAHSDGVLAPPRNEEDLRGVPRQHVDKKSSSKTMPSAVVAK